MQRRLDFLQSRYFFEEYTGYLNNGRPQEYFNGRENIWVFFMGRGKTSSKGLKTPRCYGNPETPLPPHIGFTYLFTLRFIVTRQTQLVGTEIFAYLQIKPQPFGRVLHKGHSNSKYSQAQAKWHLINFVH